MKRSLCWHIGSLAPIAFMCLGIALLIDGQEGVGGLWVLIAYAEHRRMELEEYMRLIKRALDL